MKSLEELVARVNEFERRRHRYNVIRPLFWWLMWLFIPMGMYCYRKAGRRGWCPFWDKNPGRERMMNGYCHFTGEHDGDNGAFLLWDQCKECGCKDPGWYYTIAEWMYNIRNRRKA